MVILLAAGESKRMGQPKALLPWHGTTLVEHQLFSLTSLGIHNIVVVLGSDAPLIQKTLDKNWPWVKCAYNPRYREGKTTSIKAGLHAGIPAEDEPILGNQAPSIIILGVDQPRSPTFFRRLIDAHSIRKHQQLITAPTYNGRRGHPPIFSASLHKELLELSEDTLGTREIFRRHLDAVKEIDINSPEVLLDLNTPEEYAAAYGSNVRH